MMSASREESSCVCVCRIHRQPAGKQCSDPLPGSACTVAAGRAAREAGGGWREAGESVRN